MGQIIAYSGTHGTGKTTAVFQRALQLKIAGGQVQILHEAARDCPFTILRQSGQMSVDAQKWIFAEQIRRELDATARAGVTVADRTAFDCIAYTRLVDRWLADAQLAYLVATDHAMIYDQIIVRLAANNSWQQDDGIRDLDTDTRARVERELLDVYAAAGVEYTTV